ncbi:hypothetical protein A2U01_0113844, partial [Trifolium medium]|nr:hypothetical protein [Trifolium medium]
MRDHHQNEQRTAKIDPKQDPEEQLEEACRQRRT